MRRKMLVALALLSVVVFLSACAAAEATPTPAPTATKAPAATATPVPPAATPTPVKKEKVSITIDWIAPAGKHSPFFVAIEKGWYAAEGLDVEVKTSQGSTIVMQLVGNKSTTFGFPSGDAVVKGVAAGIPAKVVAAVYRLGGSVIAGRIDKNKVTKPQDLEGLTIGTSPGSAAHQLLPEYLKASGVDVSKVKIASFDMGTRHRLAVGGEIDAMVTLLEAMPYLEEVGGGWMLTYADAGLDFVGHNIVAHNDTIKQRPDLVRKFVAATLKAVDYANKNPEEAIEILAKHAPDVQKEKERQLKVLKINMGRLYTKNTTGMPIGWSSDLDWKLTQSLLLQLGALKEEMDLTEYFTNDYLPK